MPKERETENSSGVDIVEILALYLSGRIKDDAFSDQDRAVRSYYLGLMAENEKFAALVNERKKQLLEAQKPPEWGRKIPLYSEEDLAPAKAHRKRKTRSSENAKQPRLLEEKVSGSSEPLDIFDPEKKLAVLHEAFQSSSPFARNDILNEEIRFKRNQLREEIGLPIARGKDPHVGDRVYKFLVKRIVRWDEFGIFEEFDKVMGELSADLQARIEEVSGLVGELLNTSMKTNDKFKRFKEFSLDYEEKWFSDFTRR